jgi:hypothetical protein
LFVSRDNMHELSEFLIISERELGHVNSAASNVTHNLKMGALVLLGLEEKHAFRGFLGDLVAKMLTA